MFQLLLTLHFTIRNWVISQRYMFLATAFMRTWPWSHVYRTKIYFFSHFTHLLCLFPSMSNCKTLLQGHYLLMAYAKHSFMKTQRPSLLSKNIRRVETMIEYGKYHILEGIYPHIGLHIGLLADGNIHNIKLIYRYISNNDHPVKHC